MPLKWKTRLLGFCSSGAILQGAAMLGGVLSSLWPAATALPYVAGTVLFFAAILGLRRDRTRQFAIGALACLAALSVSALFVFARVLLTGNLM